MSGRASGEEIYWKENKLSGKGKKVVEKERRYLVEKEKKNCRDWEKFC